MRLKGKMWKGRQMYGSHFSFFLSEEKEQFGGGVERSTAWKLALAFIGQGRVDSTCVSFFPSNHITVF